MSFLMPSLLIGLAGASIPVIVHLLNRQRTRPVRWGAMQFLRTSAIRTRRRKNVERWILMAVRMLAVAVLALLLARPQVVSSSPVATTSTQVPTDIAIVIDHSFSMERMSSGQTLFNRAIATTENLLRAAGPTDTMTFILAEHTPRVLNAVPVRTASRAETESLNRLLHQQKPGTTDCNIPEAIGLARRQLFEAPNPNKLVLVLSDQQRENWHSDDEALWVTSVGDRTGATSQDLRIYSVQLKPDARSSSAAVRDISIQPTILGMGRPVQISATVVNAGTESLNELTARLMLDDTAAGSKPVPPLEVKASATIQFDLQEGFPAAGSHRVKIDLSAPQAIGPMCPAYAVANVLTDLPVLIIDGQFSAAGDFSSSRFLQAALRPSEQSVVRPRVVSVSEATSLALNEYVATIVNDVPTLPPGLRDRLVEYARTGHGVWFVLGPRTQASMVERDLPQGSFLHCEVLGSRAAADPTATLAIKDAVNPMVAAFARGEQDPLAGAITSRWWSIRPTDIDAQVVVAAWNGEPLILERPYGASGGKIVVWTTSLDGAWNNWQLMPNFVPLVNETIDHLAQSQLHGLANHGLDAGQPIEWAGQSVSPIRSVKITRPDGRSVPESATFNGGRWIVTDSDTFLPGFYRMEFEPSDIPPISFGVNVDRKELTPSSLEPADVSRLTNHRFIDGVISPDQFPGLLRRGSHVRDLRVWLAGSLLLFLIVETFLTWRLMRLQTAEGLAESKNPAAGFVEAVA